MKRKEKKSDFPTAVSVRGVEGQGGVSCLSVSASTSAGMITNANISSNTSIHNLSGPIGRNHRTSRMGLLARSLLSHDTCDSIMSPNSVRDMMNPLRSKLGLPPLEISRLSKSPEENKNVTSSSSTGLTNSPQSLGDINDVSSTEAKLVDKTNTALSLADSIISPKSPEKMRSEFTGSSISNLILSNESTPSPPSKEEQDQSSRTSTYEQQSTVNVVMPVTLHAIRQNQNIPPKPVPLNVIHQGIAAVVPALPLKVHNYSIIGTPIGTKNKTQLLCPPPSSIKQKVATRSTKRQQNSGWKFPTEMVSGKEYLIMKKLGKGGCGEVSLAMEKGSRELFALKKVNLASLDDRGIDECVNEVKLLSELKNTDLVIHIEAWEMCSIDRTLKIVMEFGQCDLSKSIRSDNIVSLNKIKFIWERMLYIVAAIHQKGIVHADLKPANFVWVGGNLKIIDFGISNKLQQDFTSIAQVNPKGTLNFISPETVNQDAFGKTKISPKSDIWSLGCILHFMVFARTPFQDITHQIAKINAISKGVSSYPPLPLEFEESCVIPVMQLCFQLDPKKRPTATELLTHPFLKEQTDRFSFLT